jgi:hypothetical protein
VGETFLIYVDDSGNETHGVVFSAVVLEASSWADALGCWTRLRRELVAQPYELPTFFEIHSQGFLSVRPLKELRKDWERREKILAARSPDPVLESVALARAQVELADVALGRAIEAAAAAGRTVHDVAAAARLPQQDVKDRIARRDEPSALAERPCLRETSGAGTLRREIFGKCLAQLARMPSVRVFTAATNGSTGEAKAALYGCLLRAVDDWLRQADALGTVIVDGTPSARTLYYREAHRALALETRRILEDEVIRDSAESHFIQMADIAAHTAHRLRMGEPADYLQLADVIVTSHGGVPTAADPGFFR